MSSPARQASRLPLTGERTVPGIPEETYWFARHEVAYLDLRRRFAAGSGLRILEAGCGEGYGAELLRTDGRHRVSALDYDENTAGHVATAYPRVPVLRANLVALPLADDCCDVVTHLQVIEHLHDQDGFVAEAARVLRPGGVLAVTTPNRLTFSPGLAAPINPFHTRELSAAELVELLEPHFELTEVLGVTHGPRLSEWEAEHGSLVAELIAVPAPQWRPQLRELVASVTAADFLIRPDSPLAPIDDCLDLFVLAGRTTRHPA